MISTRPSFRACCENLSQPTRSSRSLRTVLVPGDPHPSEKRAATSYGDQDEKAKRSGETILVATRRRGLCQTRTGALVRSLESTSLAADPAGDPRPSSLSLPGLLRGSIPRLSERPGCGRHTHGGVDDWLTITGLSTSCGRR